MATKMTLSEYQYKDLQIPRTDYPNEFIQFCEHAAYPNTIRKYKDNKSFARAFKLNAGTLTNWQKLPQFNHNIRIIAKQIIGNDLPKIMEVVKNQALKGSYKHTDILLKWLGELSDAEVHIDKAVMFTWKKPSNSQIEPEDE